MCSTWHLNLNDSIFVNEFVLMMTGHLNLTIFVCDSVIFVLIIQHLNPSVLVVYTVKKRQCIPMYTTFR